MSAKPQIFYRIGITLFVACAIQLVPVASAVADVPWAITTRYFRFNGTATDQFPIPEINLPDCGGMRFGNLDLSANATSDSTSTIEAPMTVFVERVMMYAVRVEITIEGDYTIMDPGLVDLNLMINVLDYETGAIYQSNMTELDNVFPINNETTETLSGSFVVDQFFSLNGVVPPFLGADVEIGVDLDLYSESDSDSQAVINITDVTLHVTPSVLGPYLGDANDDRIYSLEDIPVFVEIMLLEVPPPGARFLVDMNRDSHIDGRDIQLFVDTMMMSCAL